MRTVEDKIVAKFVSAGWWGGIYQNYHSINFSF